MKESDLIPSIQNFIEAVTNKNPVNKQAVYELAAEMCTRNANSLAALDPNRNK